MQHPKLGTLGSLQVLVVWDTNGLFGMPAICRTQVVLMLVRHELATPQH